MKPHSKRDAIVATTIIEPYGADLDIVFADQLEAIAYQYGVNPDQVAGRAGFFAHVLSEGKFLMGFNRNHLNYGCIAHESMHCAFGILRYIGQPVEPAEEATAYLMQHINDCAITAAKQRKLPIADL